MGPIQTAAVQVAPILASIGQFFTMLRRTFRWHPEVSPVFLGWVKKIEIKATHDAIQR